MNAEEGEEMSHNAEIPICMKSRVQEKSLNWSGLGPANVCSSWKVEIERCPVWRRDKEEILKSRILRWSHQTLLITYLFISFFLWSPVELSALRVELVVGVVIRSQTYGWKRLFLNTNNIIPKYFSHTWSKRRFSQMCSLLQKLLSHKWSYSEFTGKYHFQINESVLQLLVVCPIPG